MPTTTTCTLLGWQARWSSNGLRGRPEGAIQVREPTEITYAERRRPACLVEHEGQWLPGTVRNWRQREDGWWAEVSYYTDAITAFLLEVPGRRVWVMSESNGQDQPEPA